MPASGPESSHDFDFFVGDWTCRHRYLTKRLAASADWIEFPGTCTMAKILGGLGNFDQNEIELPGDRYLGASLRLYDPATATWAIRWLDSRRPGLISPPVVGRFDNGIGLFYGDDSFGEKPIRVRFIWSRITPGAARWEQAFSTDEGNNWETNWFMDFTRL
jgi:hypothetical protein